MSTLSPFSFLARTAADNPEGIFALGLDQSLRNDEALLFAQRFAAEFRELGVVAGERVAVLLPEMLSLLVAVALFHEAAVGVAVPREGVPESVAVDWFVTDGAEDAPVIPGARVVLVDAAFLRRVQSREPATDPRAYPDATSPVRVFFSSGTTGVPKGIETSVAAMEFYGETAPETWLRGDPALMLMPLGTIFGFAGFYIALCTGRTHHLVGGATPQGLIEMILRSGATTLVGSPAQIGGVVATAESLGVRLPRVERIVTTGSVMPGALLQRLGALAGGCESHTVYGSTEATLATERYADSEDPLFVGHLVPGAEVEIVDADTRPVPAGEVGRVRHRHRAMARGYIGDPEASRLAFLDGWFYPGDLARLRADGGLVLTGRTSERLNAGGVKLDANMLDLFALDQPGVADAAAFLHRGDDGHEQIALAVVPDVGFTVQPFLDVIAARFGVASPTILLRVEAIPRNTMGKPLRRELAAGYRG